MNFWDFAHEHWWIALFMFAIAVKGVVVIINRSWRHWNIRLHGYPPTHCDADGDFPVEPERD